MVARQRSSDATKNHKILGKLILHCEQNGINNSTIYLLEDRQMNFSNANDSILKIFFFGEW